MQTANRVSKFIGVTLRLKNGKDLYWECRVQRKHLRFRKTFPFTERGEELAGQTYQQKINELYCTK